MDRSKEEFLKGLSTIEAAICNSVALTTKLRFGSPLQPEIVWNNGRPFDLAVPEKVNVLARTAKASFTCDVDREVIEDCSTGMDRHEAR